MDKQCSIVGNSSGEMSSKANVNDVSLRSSSQSNSSPSHGDSDGCIEVLDDDGILETYDVSSSNSMPLSDAVVVDDSSSTDTIKVIDNCSNPVSTTNIDISSKVYIINDDDDFVNESEINETSQPLVNALHSSTTHTITSDMSNGGETIFLETPIIEEQQHHAHTSNPKRLSDKFLLEDDSLVATESPENASSDLQHDRMSFRLKKMNINTAARDTHADMPTTSGSSLIKNVIKTDATSMDLIERKDFETEQRLTGSVILKSSSLINKNKLNLNFLNSNFKGQVTHQEDGNVGDDEKKDSSTINSNVLRAVSSDSKCAYKDLTATPTSSRSSSSRLTKSTAKINLCSTLSHTQQSHNRPRPQNISSSALYNKPSTSTLNIMSVEATSMPSSVSQSIGKIVSNHDEFSNSNSNDSHISSTSTNKNIQNSALKKLNKTLEDVPKESIKDSDRGCSRTMSILNANPEDSVKEMFDDSQPSTSSARCQYPPVAKNVRQHINNLASGRYHARSNTAAVDCLPSSSVFGPSNNISRSIISSSNINTCIRTRPRNESTNEGRNNEGDEVFNLFNVPIINVPTQGEPIEYNDDAWENSEENNSDIEEICTCHHSSSESSIAGSNTSLNETDELDCSSSINKDGDLSNYIQMVSISEESAYRCQDNTTTTATLISTQRKRKYNEGFMSDNEYTLVMNSNSSNCPSDLNSRKRVAYERSPNPRSTQQNISLLSMVNTPSTSQMISMSFGGSPISGKRASRNILPTRENPPPELQNWLSQFQRWSHAERLLAVDRLIEHCEPTQVRHMMKVIEPQFQRDFISLLPRELALQVLAYLEPCDLLRAAQTCRSWRFLCDDNLLWKEKCRKSQILAESRNDRPKRGRAGNMPPIASPWKAAFMRQHIIEMNWRSRPVREPKVLKGHDDHVITCLQFSGNRIVSGSDDNTLKVWSAVTGRCLRTLVGHTGGVWSSQMSGNIIISGSTDRTLKVWDMETGQCLHTLLGHTSTVRCMHLFGNKVVSGSRDATLRVWDIDQGTCLHVLVGHLAAVRCVQYDGKLIVSGAYDYMVKIWHPERQECLHTLQGHTNRVYSLQFDGLHVVSGSLDTSIRVWDVETGNCKHTLMGHQSLTSGMELRQNILVSGNADSTVKVWDITTGQCLQTLSGPNKHQSAVTCLQFNSRFVVTSSDDGTVKLWDVKTGEFIRNLVALESGGSGGVVWRIRANDTKLICAVGSRNGTEETKLMVLDFDVEGACVKCS